MSRRHRFHLLPFVVGPAAASIIAVGCATGSFEEATLPTEDSPHDAARDRSTTKDRKDASSTDAPAVGDDDDDDDDGDDDDGGQTKPDGGQAKPDAGGVKDASTDAKPPPDASVPDAGGDAGGPADAGIPKPVQGEIVISEVMYDALGTEPGAEWIEIYNKASSSRSLSGLIIRDASNRSHTILPGVTAPPGEYVVLASLRASAVASQVPDTAIIYEYNAGSGTDVQLANSSSGGVVLLDGTTEVARAKYGALGLGSANNGQSIQLKVLDYASAGSKSNWCYSPTAWAVGSAKGTPGSPSDCP